MTLFWFFLGATAVCLVMLIAAVIWGIVEKGATSKRTGSEVHAALVKTEMKRQARSDGEVVYGSKAISHGDGVELSGSVNYSYIEILQAWRSNDLRSVAPGLLLFVSLLGIFLFGAFTLLLGPGSAPLLGVGLLLMCGMMVRIIVQGIQAARAELDA